jgi:hypothetical protein
MLKPGNRVFVQLSDGGDRRLAPATVVDSGKGRFGLALDDDTVQSVDGGAELYVYFEAGGVFVVEQVSVEDSVRREDHLEIVIAELGAPISAESRQEQRFNVERSGMVIGIDGVICPLVDVSESGFCVIHRSAFCAGDVLDVELPVGERMYSGRARTMSVAWMEAGAFRCGFSCLSHAGVEDLQTGLQELIRPGARGIWAAA